MHRQIFAATCVLFYCGDLAAQTPSELRLGRANHAFDHLGDIGGQAEAAAASGATIIYTGGLGAAGYHGLPPEKDFKALRENVSAYNRRAKANGIKLAIGYLCATSIIKLDTFDKNWSEEFRAQFKTRPAEWRQQDRHGKPLASWYGGDYQPACMSNPDWRAYQRAMVHYTLETGHDGVFFDNPTVHPQGCYCLDCMKGFAKYAAHHPPKKGVAVPPDDVDGIRQFADAHSNLFLRFRSTIARDFLADMRAYARTINPKALITCNNSLNSPSVFYSQSRTYGYNIDEMSQAEDFVVVEDMNTQPRIEANGQMIEYGPTYKMLHAISHEKPIVAVTIANADYHTAPNLTRLAMAEAAANNASYMSWPTWPENQRQRMIAAVRPQADFLRRNEKLLIDAPFRADVVLYLPFQLWRSTDHCATSAVAATLTTENIQYKVVGDVEFLNLLQKELQTQQISPILLVESPSVLADGGDGSFGAIEKRGQGIVAADQPDWLSLLRRKIGKPSVSVKGAPSVRAVVHDQNGRAIVHLYNLNIQRLSSFEDKVTAATGVQLIVRVPFEEVGEVNIQTADESLKPGGMKYNVSREGDGASVAINLSRLDISSIITIEKKTP